MSIRLRTLFIVWVIIVSLTLWALIDSLSAGITRPVIPKSELKWSSYHAYHSILYWDGDKVTYSMSRIRQVLKSCEGNRKWAKKMVKRLKLKLPKSFSGICGEGKERFSANDAVKKLLKLRFPEAYSLCC